MGYTLRAALDVLGPGATVEVAELVPAVAEWNRDTLGNLAGHPLRDRRTQLHLDDVHSRITAGRSTYDVILLDVDNSPAALAHPTGAVVKVCDQAYDEEADFVSGCMLARTCRYYLQTDAGAETVITVQFKGDLLSI